MDNSENIVAAFSADQVARITELTMRQLAYWDRTGFFQPQYASENRRSPHSRIYSFHDLVGLRTLSVLTNIHGVPMNHLKAVAERLSAYTKRPWSDIKLAVWNRKVQWIEPDTGRMAGVLDGQYVLVELVNVVGEMRDEVRRARQRDPAEFGQISQQRNVAHNQAVVSGTRIPVHAIKAFHKAGYSVSQIIKEYPTLTDEDVNAALRHASKKAAA